MVGLIEVEEMVGLLEAVKTMGFGQKTAPVLATEEEAEAV